MNKIFYLLLVLFVFRSASFSADSTIFYKHDSLLNKYSMKMKMGTSNCAKDEFYITAKYFDYDLMDKDAKYAIKCYGKPVIDKKLKMSEIKDTIVKQLYGFTKLAILRHLKWTVKDTTIDTYFQQNQQHWDYLYGRKIYKEYPDRSRSFYDFN